MGNLQSKYHIFILKPQDWQIIPTTRNLILNINNQNIGTFCQFQQIYQDVLQTFAFRANYQQYLVGFYGILYKHNDTICYFNNVFGQKIGKLSNIKIVIPNIQYRLSDLGMLSLEEAMYVAYQSINGLKLIMQKYGKVVPNLQQEFIGINQAGQCKIWINQNYFQANFQVSNNNLDEKEIVKQLFELIQRRMVFNLQTEKKQQYYLIKSSFLPKNKQSQINFVNSLKFIQALCNLNNLNLNKTRLDVPTIQNPQKPQIKQLQLLLMNDKIEGKQQKSKRKISLKNRSGHQLYNSIKSSKQKPSTTNKNNYSKTTLKQKIKLGSNNPTEGLLTANSRVTKDSQETFESDTQNRYKLSLKYRTYKRMPSHIY